MSLPQWLFRRKANPSSSLFTFHENCIQDFWKAIVNKCLAKLIDYLYNEIVLLLMDGRSIRIADVSRQFKNVIT